MTDTLAQSLVDAVAEALREHHIDDTKYDRAQDHDACKCGPRIEDWDTHWAHVAVATAFDRLAEGIDIDYLNGGDLQDLADKIRRAR